MVDIIILGFDAGNIVGLDGNENMCGIKFSGFKNVPSGPHFLYIMVKKIKSENLSFGNCSGIFFHLKGNEQPMVLKYDEVCEELMIVGNVKELEDGFLKNYRKKFIQYMADIDNTISNSWIKYTSHVNFGIIEKVSNCSKGTNCECSLLNLKLIHIYPYLRFKHFTYEIEKIDYDLEMKDDEHPTITFTCVNVRNNNEIKKLTPTQITVSNMDYSIYLERLFETMDSPFDLIGEFQIIFILLTMGQLLQIFYHWKRIIVVICFSDTAIIKYPEFFQAFISAFIDQIKSSSLDTIFIDDNFGQRQNFLYLSMQRMIQNIFSIQDSSSDGRIKSLKDISLLLRDALKSHFSWEIDLFESNNFLQDYENDEDAPVVIDMDDKKDKYVL